MFPVQAARGFLGEAAAVDDDQRPGALNAGQKTPLRVVAASVAAAVITTMLLFACGGGQFP
ncbi:MAG: hypothetical protein M0Z36_00675 [Thermaerobacter sp.]|nr:hypothetical protein [Thermaerobacter sp.]